LSALEPVQGPAGPPGPQGPSPARASVDTTADLPAEPKPGYLYYVEDTGHAWTYDFAANAWIDLGNFMGESGPPGPAGPQGVEGPAGATGPQGATGAEGSQGVPGPEGAAGAQGPQGAQGATGKGTRILGEVPTPADLPTANNKPGDAYIVTSDGDLYIWSTDVDPAAWVDAGQVVGPQGPTGPEGVQGSPGPQGAQGVPGPQGGQGVEGATGPAGAQGPQGAAGAKGDTGAQGAQGPKGDPGPAGSSEFFYGEGTTNVTVAVNAASAAGTVISSGAQTYTAVPHLIEFFCPQGVTGASTTSTVNVSLWDGSTDLGVIASVKNNTNVALNVPVYGRRRLTPTAGSHTFVVKAFAAGNAGALNAGAGGPGLNLPLHLRIVKLS
jgi:hypothetical protein